MFSFLSLQWKVIPYSLETCSIVWQLNNWKRCLSHLDQLNQMLFNSGAKRCEFYYTYSSNQLHLVIQYLHVEYILQDSRNCFAFVEFESSSAVEKVFKVRLSCSSGWIMHYIDLVYIYIKAWIGWQTPLVPIPNLNYVADITLHEHISHELVT